MLTQVWDTKTCILAREITNHGLHAAAPYLLINSAVQHSPDSGWMWQLWPPASVPWLLTLHAADLAALGLPICVCACPAYEVNHPCLLSSVTILRHSITCSMTEIARSECAVATCRHTTWAKRFSRDVKSSEKLVTSAHFDKAAWRSFAQGAYLVNQHASLSTGLPGQKVFVMCFKY